MDKKNNAKKSIFKEIEPYLGKTKSYIPIAIILSLVSAILKMVPFYFIWKIINELFSSNTNISIQNVRYYSLGIIVFVAAGMFVYFAGIMASHFAAFEVETSIKKEGFKKVMNMPFGFFNQYTSGKIRKIINDGAAETHLFLAHELADFAGALITPVLVIAIFFYFDWRLGLAAMCPIILGFIMISKMMSKEGVKFYNEYMDALEEMNSEAVEYVRAIPVVKTFGQSIKSFTRFYNSIINYKTLIIASNKLYENTYSLYQVFIEATALFLIPIAILIINSSGDIATTISNFVLYILVAPQISVVMLKSAYFRYHKVVAEHAMERYNSLFDYNEMKYPEKGLEFINQEIEFKTVDFSYDGETKVLDNVSFKVNKGETLALVGASGSGKTTIARLVARFWDVDSGEVLIGSKNIKEYDKETLMNNITFVFQNTELFKLSLRDNISFGREVTDEEIEEALKMSRSKEIIDYLKDGLETVIGTKGTYLSGGEKQRIALARAFIKDAPIILLDEATAFADLENEHLIQDALKDLSSGKTTIMIAHRMTTVKNADKIAVIDKGQIVEYGDHDYLMSLSGLYKKMWDEYQSTIDWNIKGA